MQIDMHFYGVYALARAAGFKPVDAHTLAFASQFVDDANRTDTEDHRDGGKMRAIATAHQGGQVAKNRVVDILEQRRVWVPFHFLPGGLGETLSEQLLCQIDSGIAREMMRNHMDHAAQSDYALELMGIACHVYADTFSHWGFSGVSSRLNAAVGNSFEFVDLKNEEMKVYIENKFAQFMRKYTPSFLIRNWRKIASDTGERVSGALGHGAVGTYPDRPYLHWKFTYQHRGQDPVSDRDNPRWFLEAARKIHEWLSELADRYYGGEVSGRVEFSAIRDKVDQIIRLEAPKEDRIAAWKEAVRSGALFTPAPNEAHHYDAADWENVKDGFPGLDHSSNIIGTHVYAYHQAALYHRDYVLKQLLPRHGIAVY